MRETAAMPVSCTATTRSGEPCRNRPLAGSRLCFFHTDAADPIRRESAARGGRNRSNTERARRHAIEAEMSLPDVRRALGMAIAGTLTGNIAPGVGTAVAALSRAYVTVSEAAGIEDRIAALEAALEARGGSR